MTNQQNDGASSLSPSLPDDVIAEILAYLPAKSVGRLRCVSRSWHAVLSSAPFVKLHLRLANDKPKIFFTPTQSDSDDDYQFYAWQLGCAAAVTKLMPNDFSRPALLTRPRHGLVLLRCIDEGGYYVCNPSTGEVQRLPDSRAPLKMASRRLPLPRYFNVVYGFGYSSVSREYKAVRIFSDDHPTEAPPSSSSWVATRRCTAGVVEEKNPAVFLHGNLHFLCQDDDDILTFNVADESFAVLSQPPCPGPSRMTELDGCLCVFQRDGDGPCHVWLLRNYAARRWEKLCCIDPTAWPEPERTLLESHWLSRVGICNKGNGSEKRIMFGTGTCKVFKVDLDGGGVPDILLKPDEVIAGDFEDTYSYPAIGLFEESLVTLDDTIEEKVFSSPVSKAWSEVLKWLPARSVLQLSLTCREWRAMVDKQSNVS